MSLKLQSVGFQRHTTPVTLYASLQDDKNNSVNVTFQLEPHHQLDKLTIEEISHLAHEAAKRLHV
ncbi:hypothetical protein WK11_25435 [Burkholderia ubonensis]|uniref:hypothetical protein n=1 Tax=Burkholderia ubonensis TaxID=101571 RepID=UPI00075754E8|nr:hypothetical protein [Burkholderia ubonensis]KVR16116.1 hypothetical protein WK11_25435 [Burkholderia ubonensis]KVT77665.1 hypothetical protein WK58_10260 [Burkholderia ubonensis]